MYDRAKVNKFFELLAEIVNVSAPFSDKREALLVLGDEADRANLEELASWFDV